MSVNWIIQLAIRFTGRAGFDVFAINGELRRKTNYIARQGFGKFSWVYRAIRLWGGQTAGDYIFIGFSRRFETYGEFFTGESINLN